MLARIEIYGFETFESFGLDLRPSTAIVGPNASGKSKLFDALRFPALPAKNDIRTAMGRTIAFQFAADCASISPNAKRAR